MKCCESCEFWFEEEGLPARSGTCQRFPPVAYDVGESDWPHTSPVDRCGEYNQRSHDPPIGDLVSIGFARIHHETKKLWLTRNIYESRHRAEMQASRDEARSTHWKSEIVELFYIRT